MQKGSVDFPFPVSPVDAGGALAGLDGLAYKEALRGRNALGSGVAASADLD